MLYKKELLSLPLAGCPPYQGDPSCRFDYSLSGRAASLPLSGDIFYGEFYSFSTHSIVCRYFCDREKLYAVYDFENPRFSVRNLPGMSLYSYSNVYCCPDAESSGLIYFGRPSGNTSLYSILCSFVSNFYADRDFSKSSKKYSLLYRLLALIPSFPDALEPWLNVAAFKPYIFIGKSAGGFREASCGLCGHLFALPSSSLSGHCICCPSCGADSVLRGSWINHCATDVSRFRYSISIGGNLINVVYKVIRRVPPPCSGTPACYEYEYICIYSDFGAANPSLSCRYDYIIQPNYRGWSLNPCIYTDSFPELPSFSYFLDNLPCFRNIELSPVLSSPSEVSSDGLIVNMQMFPCTEYFFKLGLYSLASSPLMEVAGSRLSDFCIERHNLCLYSDFDATYSEHLIISCSPSAFPRDSFVKLRHLLQRFPSSSVSESFVSMFKALPFPSSPSKLVCYLYSQFMLDKTTSFSELIASYLDYIKLAVILNYDFTRKSVRYPRFLYNAHSLACAAFVELSDSIALSNLEAVSSFFSFSSFTDGRYTVVFPESKADFISEGQSLNHCLGKVDSYFDDHAKVKKLVFFVRRVSAPDKPFATFQVDMSSMEILQLRGFGNSSVPPDVSSFADSFVRSIIPSSLPASAA